VDVQHIRTDAVRTTVECVDGTERGRQSLHGRTQWGRRRIHRGTAGEYTEEPPVNAPTDALFCFVYSLPSGTVRTMNAQTATANPRRGTARTSYSAEYVDTRAQPQDDRDKLTAGEWHSTEPRL